MSTQAAGTTGGVPHVGIRQRLRTAFPSNELGVVTATAPAVGEQADTTLPDATKYARWSLWVALGLALIVAVVLNQLGWTKTAFKPAQSETADFALFAGFYVAAQVIERLMELVTPLLPLGLTKHTKDVDDHAQYKGWFRGIPAADLTGAALAAQVKADRAKLTLGVASLLGVVASCAFGLFFLTAVGISTTHTVDALATGLVIAAGTKPLHDFTSYLQNKNSPESGTSTR